MKAYSLPRDLVSELEALAELRDASASHTVARLLRAGMDALTEEQRHAMLMLANEHRREETRRLLNAEAAPTVTSCPGCGDRSNVVDLGDRHRCNLCMHEW